VLGDAGQAVLGMSAVDFYNIHDDFHKVSDLCNRLKFKEVSLLVRAKYDERSTSNDDGPLSNIRFVIVREMPDESKKMAEMLLARLAIYKNK
jgi:hypothetical protein